MWSWDLLEKTHDTPRCHDNRGTGSGPIGHILSVTQSSKGRSQPIPRQDHDHNNPRKYIIEMTWYHRRIVQPCEEQKSVNLNGSRIPWGSSDPKYGGHHVRHKTLGSRDPTESAPLCLVPSDEDNSTLTTGENLMTHWGSKKGNLQTTTDTPGWQLGWGFSTDQHGWRLENGSDRVTTWIGGRWHSNGDTVLIGLGDYQWREVQCHPVYTRNVDPSVLTFSLSSHRHSSTSLLFRFRFID